jgi:predicted RNA-binding Zn ribbon-like protein
LRRNLKASISAAKNELALIGRRLAVGFANLRVAPWNLDASLEGFTRFIEFLAASGVIPIEAMPALLNLWTSAPGEATALLEGASSLRSALRNAFEARASGDEILVEWVEEINKILSYTEGHDRLEPMYDRADGEPEWRLALHARAQGLEWLLTAIARNGAELIAEGPRAPIRKCANPACGLFIYDDSRTGRRRWCSMAVCGNRAKVAAHYRREKNKK